MKMYKCGKNESCLYACEGKVVVKGELKWNILNLATLVYGIADTGKITRKAVLNLLKLQIKELEKDNL